MWRHSSAEVAARPEVLECFRHHRRGRDYYLRVMCADLDAYNLFWKSFCFDCRHCDSAEFWFAEGDQAGRGLPI